jgi:peptide/nickel transport system substrate-binding protein
LPRHFRWQLALAAAGLVAIGALLSIFANRTFVDRPARGGQLTEAVVGSPDVLNPLFAASNAEIDIVRLLYAGLTKPDAQGRIVADIALRWEVSDDGTTYRFYLRREAVWHDGEPVTADDVVFTAELAADDLIEPTLAPLARQWANTTARRIDDHTVELVLNEAYAPFLAATTLGLLPQHLFSDVPASEVARHRHSTLEPIGAGPYRLRSPGGITQEAIQLERFDRHWLATERQPYIETLTLRLLPDEAAALDALGRQTAQAMGGLSSTALRGLSGAAAPYSAGQAGYTLIYLNFQRVLFRDASVRRALSIALDREAIVGASDLVDGQGVPAASPIARGSWAYDGSVQPVRYSPDEAERILESAGWIDSDGNRVRDHEGKSLSLTLGVADDEVLKAVAEYVRTQWSTVGVEVTVQPMDQQRLIAELTNRTYDAILFSWVLRSYDPDPFPLWHSSQAVDGQNFGGWEDAQADVWLAEARRTNDLAAREELYGLFQRRFAREQPAIMLYHPLYTYGVLDGAVGAVQLPQLVVEPADRFLTAREWFVETERVFFGEARE